MAGCGRRVRIPREKRADPCQTWRYCGEPAAWVGALVKGVGHVREGYRCEKHAKDLREDRRLRVGGEQHKEDR
jgi:hypothetical protein